ncbi:Branched-chain-amino-acid aminotransferase [Planctomycetes bacterium Poly30]|uniref:Branched-chain-amino-acid aminotransferase n=2 Tax=Saltatorellus ferox TaxID=2528018 RepID=A0A518EXC9_9BACT|nr:Branched-chain-amino-acid aminotransferase [Planctomycetes bacterium Poly30]
MDGEIVPWESATVHVMTHALHYGSSVFEGIRAYSTDAGPCFFPLEAHVDRFFDSAAIYRMQLPFDRSEMRNACHAVVRENRLEAAYVRPLAFHGYGQIGLNPGTAPARVVVAAVPWGSMHGKAAIEHGIDACVSSWQRIAPNTIPVLAKAGGNYLSGQLIHMEALRNGYHEGIALGPDGTVSEGAGENLFVVKNGVIRTPRVSGSLLAGITRDAVIQLGADLGCKIEEATIPRETLYTADEVFMTGTAAEITPVRSVDRAPIGTGRPGPITQRIQQAFFGLFEGTTPDRHGWLETVHAEVAV